MSTSEGARAVAKLPRPPCRAPGYEPSVPGITFKRNMRRFAVEFEDIQEYKYPYGIYKGNYTKFPIDYDEYRAHVAPPNGFGYPGDVWLVTAPDALAVYVRLETAWLRWRGPLASEPILHPIMRNRSFWLGYPVQIAGTWVSSATYKDYCGNFSRFLRERSNDLEACRNNPTASAAITLADLLNKEQRKQAAKDDADLIGASGTYETYTMRGGPSVATAGPSTLRLNTTIPPALQVGGVDDDADPYRVPLSARTAESLLPMADVHIEASMDVDGEGNILLEPVVDDKEHKIDALLRQLFSTTLGLGPGASLDEETLSKVQPMMRIMLDGATKLYTDLEESKAARLTSDQRLNAIRAVMGIPVKSEPSASARPPHIVLSEESDPTATVSKNPPMLDANRRFSYPGASTHTAAVRSRPTMEPLGLSLAGLPGSNASAMQESGLASPSKRERTLSSAVVAAGEVQKRPRTSHIALQTETLSGVNATTATPLTSQTTAGPAFGSGAGLSSGGGASSGTAIQLPAHTLEIYYHRILYRDVGDRMQCRTCQKAGSTNPDGEVPSFAMSATVEMWFGHCARVHAELCRQLAPLNMWELLAICRQVDAEDGIVRRHESEETI